MRRKLSWLLVVVGVALAVTAIAVMNRVHLIRTHDVKETLQAVRAAEAIRARSPRAGLVL